MAIRPVDLQLAYLAAQQNATIVRNAEEAPAIAQQAANANFAAQVHEREETVVKTDHTVGNKVRPRGEERPQEQELADQQGSPHHPPEEAPAEPLGLAGEGRHFIDVTA